MEMTDGDIISWAWEGEGKIEQGGQIQEGNKKKKSLKVLSEGAVKCHETTPFVSNLWKGV